MSYSTNAIEQSKNASLKLDELNAGDYRMQFQISNHL